ncbi:MAG: TRAP transporter small permease [Neomegalonema sp.]|nr:TRAP transporter small permease [Neomegalonema sp.]
MSAGAGKAASAFLLYASGACFLVGAAVTVVDVSLRAAMGANVPAAIELTSLSIGLGALISMPVCYLKRSHVTAKLLSELSPRRFARPLGFLGALVSVGFALLLFWIMLANVLEKLGSPETTSDLGLSKPLALIIVAITMGAGLIAALVSLVWPRIGGAR